MVVHYHAQAMPDEYGQLSSCLMKADHLLTIMSRAGLTQIVYCHLHPVLSASALFADSELPRIT